MPVRSSQESRIPRVEPKTLIDIDNPDDAEFPVDPSGDGSESEEMPEIEVPEIESPDDGMDIIEDSRKGRLFKNV